MVAMLHKTGPTLVVAVVFTWLCWPYLSGSATNTTVEPVGDVAALPKGLLSPTLRPGNDRDPFRAVDAAVGLLRGVQAGAGRPARGRTNLREAAAADGPAAPSGTPEFALGGTFIQGARRMAIINEKVYMVGETIEASGAAAKGGKVTAIFPDKALVQWGSETIEATYPKPGESPAAAAKEPDARSEPTTATPTEAASAGAHPASASDLIRQLQALQK